MDPEIAKDIKQLRRELVIIQTVVDYMSSTCGRLEGRLGRLMQRTRSEAGLIPGEEDGDAARVHPRGQRVHKRRAAVDDDGLLDNGGTDPLVDVKVISPRRHVVCSDDDDENGGDRSDAAATTRQTKRQTITVIYDDDVDDDVDDVNDNVNDNVNGNDNDNVNDKCKLGPAALPSSNGEALCVKPRGLDASALVAHNHFAPCVDEFDDEDE